MYTIVRLNYYDGRSLQLHMSDASKQRLCEVELLSRCANEATPYGRQKDSGVLYQGHGGLHNVVGEREVILKQSLEGVSELWACPRPKQSKAAWAWLWHY